METTPSNSEPISPPFTVRLVASIFLVSGVDSVFSIIEGLIMDRLHLSFEIVGIPIGIGLLNGNMIARKWAVALLTITNLTFVLIGFFAFWWRTRSEWKFFGPLNLVLESVPEWVIYAVALLAIILCTMLITALLSNRVALWFQLPNGKKRKEGNWAIPICLIAATTSLGISVRDHIWKHAIDEFFTVETAITFRDSETNKPIQTGIGERSKGVFSRKTDPLGPRVSISWNPGSDKNHIVLNGFSGQPFTKTFTAEGYESVTYTFNKNTPSSLTLDLKPEKSR